MVLALFKKNYILLSLHRTMIYYVNWSASEGFQRLRKTIFACVKNCDNLTNACQVTNQLLTHITYLFSTVYEWEHVFHSQSWVKWTTSSCYWGVYVIKHSNTLLLKDMEFLFFCSTQYLTHSLRSIMRYRIEHSSEISYLLVPLVHYSLFIYWFPLQHLYFQLLGHTQ